MGSFTYGNLYRKENFEVGMSLKRNFWKGRRRKSVQVYIIHISKKKKLLSWSKKGVKFRVPSAKSSSPFFRAEKIFVVSSRGIGNWGVGREDVWKDFSAEEKGRKRRNAMKALPSDWNRIGILT